MSVWINFRPGFEKLRYALTSCHPVIILQGGYRFQSAFEINQRIRAQSLAFIEL